jgi:hypothetical protein
VVARAKENIDRARRSALILGFMTAAAALLGAAAAWYAACAVRHREELFMTRLVGLTPWAVVRSATQTSWRQHMNGLIYLIGLIVVIMAVLSLLGLR